MLPRLHHLINVSRIESRSSETTAVISTIHLLSRIADMSAGPEASARSPLEERSETVSTPKRMGSILRREHFPGPVDAVFGYAKEEPVIVSITLDEIIIGRFVLLIAA